MARRYLTRCTAAKLASWFGVDTDTAQRILDYQPRSFAILTSNMLLTPAQVERITDSSHVYVFFGADTRSQEITRDDDSHPNSHDSTTVGHNIDVGHKSGVVGHNSDTVSHDSDTVSHDSDTVGHDSDTVGHDSGASGHDSGVVGHKSDDARGRDTQVEQGDSSHTHCVKPLSADSLQAKYAEVVDNSPINSAVAPEKCDRHLDCKDANLAGSETEDIYTSEHIAQRDMPKCVKTLYGESGAPEGGAAESLTMQHRGSDFVASAKGNSPQFLWDDNFDPYHQANLLDRFNAFEANQARINENTEKCMRASSATLARLSETMDAMDRRSFTITAAMTKQSDMISSSLAEKSEQALVDLANKSDYTLVSLEARASTALDAIDEKSERAFEALQCTTKSAIADLNTNMHKMMQVFSAFSANQANECQKDASTSSDSQETDSVCLTADNLETYAKGGKPPTGQNVHISKDLGENFSTSQQTAAVKAPKGAQAQVRTQLAKRYAERNTSSIRRSELQAATQSALESITDFGERIAFLASEGYPDIPPHNRNEIEVEAFLRGCYDQENVKWVLHGTHVTLDDAIDGMLKAQRNAKTLATTQSLKAVRAVQGKSVQFKDEKEDNAIGMSDVLSSIKSLQEHVERMSACEGTFKVYASPASQRRTSNTYERQSRSPSPVRSGAYSSRDFNRNPRSYGDFDRSPHRYTSENPNRNFQNRSVNRDFERSPQRTHYENFNRNSRMQNYDSNRKHSPVHRQSRFSSDKNNNRFRSPRQGHDNRSYSGHDNRSNSGHRHRLDSDSRTPAQAGGYRNSPRSDNSHRERNFRSGGDRPNRSYTPKFSERRTRRVLSEERYSDDHTPGEEVLDYSVPDNMSDDDSLTSLESLNP